MTLDAIIDNFMTSLIRNKLVDTKTFKSDHATIKQFYTENFKKSCNGNGNGWFLYQLDKRGYIEKIAQNNIKFNEPKIKYYIDKVDRTVQPGQSRDIPESRSNTTMAAPVRPQRNQQRISYINRNAPEDFSIVIEDATFTREQAHKTSFILAASYQGDIRTISPAESSVPIAIHEFNTNSKTFKISGANNYEVDMIVLKVQTEQNQTFDYAIPIDVSNGKRTDFIIKGTKAEYYNMLETKPLKAYRIPKEFRHKLCKLAREHPEFIERMPDLRNLTDFFNNLNIGRGNHNPNNQNVDMAWNQLQKSFFLYCAEQLGVNTKLTEQNYTTMLEHLLHIEEYQMEVDIHYYDRPSLYFPNPAIITFERELSSPFHNKKTLLYQMQVEGLSEGRPSLLKNDSVFVRYEQGRRVKYEGVVHKTRANVVVLAFHRMFEKIHVRNAKNQRFLVEFGFNRRPLRVQKQAVELVKEHRIAKYFFPDSKVDLGNAATDEPNYFNKHLNEEQKRAVRNILVKKDAPYLIFGPPGTGKTITVVEAILQIWKYKPECNILVCTPSNAAADVLMKRLEKIIPRMHLYRLCGHTYGESLRTLANLGEDMINLKNGQLYYPDFSFLKKKQVILTTLVTAARLVNGDIPWFHFSYTFIDEGGYATETESILPISGILSHKDHPSQICGQVVIAGDPRQLGPRIHSNFNKFCGFGISMLGRLIDTCEIYARDETREIPYDERCITKLLINYRSHESILRVPNELFYDGELRTANDNFSQLFTDWEHLPKQGFPIIFNNVIGKDTRDKTSPSFFNEAEIKEVMKYIDMLLKDTIVKGKKISEEDIAVITPYKRQIEKIQNECKKQGFTKVKIGTVQVFQGKENLVTIISTVRSVNAATHRLDDEFYDLGLLKSPKRFNVATTRAKSLLLVVGNGSVLKLDRYWRPFLRHCIENGAVVGPSVVLSDDDVINDADGVFSADDDGPDFGAGYI